MRYAGSRSFKVINFRTNQNDICGFLLVVNSNFGLSQSRFRDISMSHLTRSLGWFFANTLMNLIYRKVESMGYPQWERHHPTFIRFDTYCGRTHRQRGRKWCSYCNTAARCKKIKEITKTKKTLKAARKSANSVRLVCKKVYGWKDLWKNIRF